MHPAFKEGFIKRAMALGINKYDAEVLFKSADFKSLLGNSAHALGNVGSGLGHISSPMGIKGGVGSMTNGWNAGSFDYHGQTQLPQINHQNAIGNTPIQSAPTSQQLNQHLQSLKSVQSSINNPKGELMADLGSSIDV